MTGAGLAPSTGVCLPQDTALTPPGKAEPIAAPGSRAPGRGHPFPAPEGWGAAGGGGSPSGCGCLARLPSLPGWGLLICLDSFHCLHPLALRGCEASRQGQAHSSQASPGLAEQGSINICQAGPCLSLPATTLPVCTHTHTHTHTHTLTDPQLTATPLTYRSQPQPAPTPPPPSVRARAHTHTHTPTHSPQPSPLLTSYPPPHFFLPHV